MRTDEKANKPAELEPLQIAVSSQQKDTATKNNLSHFSAVDEEACAASSPLVLDDGPWTGILEFFFPSNTPKELQLLRIENLAIPACYLVVGILQGTFRPLLNVWPLDLGATEAQQTTMATIATLPCTFKLFFGFWSDNFPIAGLRRKPYMLAGWLLCFAMMAILTVGSDVTIAFDNENHNGKPIASPDAPSILLLSVIFFFYGCGLWVADVMADSIVAQKARLEPEAQRGQLQSTCYTCRFFGLMVAAPISTSLYSTQGPTILVRILLLVPISVIPLIVQLQEDLVLPPHFRHQCAEIWKTVCMRSVWQPLAFCYIFNLLQVSNAAWRQFLSTVLYFTEKDLNMLLVVSYIFLYVGSLIYKYCFLHCSWQRLYQVTILINCLVTSLQLLLIQGKTMGLSPLWFALGDDALAEFIVGMQFLPTAILMVTLCPTGSEGASYAMFTTVWNSAQMLAPAISSRWLLGIWDVGKETLAAGHLQGLFNLTVLTTAIQISPIFIIGWLPHGRDELLALSQKPYSGSPIGGAIFLLVLVVSMAITFYIAIANILLGGKS